MRGCGWVLLVGSLVAVGAPRAAAQDRELGLKVGASLSTLQQDRTAADGPYDHRTGITGGAYFVQPLRDRFGVQFEVLFTEKGASLPFNPPSLVQGEMSIRYKFHYMDVPVLARVRGPRIGSAQLHGFAGPTFSLRLEGKRQTVFSGQGAFGFEDELGGEMERFDIGLTAGAGVQIGRALLDARYTHGVNEVVAGLEGDRLRNRGFLITAGVRVF